MYLGIDVGSVSTDAVLIDKDLTIVGYAIEKSGFNHKAAIQNCILKIEEVTGVRNSAIRKTVGTGYGRRNVEGAEKVVTEISCHAMGIHHLYPEVRTVIDIGGQDSKVIRVTGDGFVDTFVMNDKCAAGTGRFLEVMANAMELGVEKLGDLSLQAENAQSISSICTVFAESEVISKIAEGHSKENIVAGIHRSISERIMGLVKAVGAREEIALTGGVAKNSGVFKSISDHFDHNLLVPKEPQIIGALGAALFAKNAG